MEIKNDVRHGRNCAFSMYVNLVFGSKYRRMVFDQDALACLGEIFSRVCDRAEAELVEMNGEGDHVHLLINYSQRQLSPFW